MVDDHEARLEKLEVDLAHAVNTIEELNSVVFEQARQIDRMTRAMANMTDQVEELMENSQPGHQIEKPPHY
ncbi:SlyX family protein [Roseibium sp.]|uniref:SlyX family protein n=1 Tax=Roseibium sp. TaxID=1936156 RepID=UPI0032630D78